MITYLYNSIVFMQLLIIPIVTSECGACALSVYIYILYIYIIQFLHSIKGKVELYSYIEVLLLCSLSVRSFSFF